MDYVEKRGRGRPKKEDVKKYSHMFRLNETDSRRLMRIFKQSKARSMAQFLSDKVFNSDLPVIEINKSAIDFVILLTQFFAQMRGVKTNYNQCFALLIREVGEDKARFRMKILEDATRDFILSWQQFELITNELRERWLPK